MVTKSGRTPSKVRANREAVVEYFNSMKQEPVKDGSVLKQTPSGLHFNIPSKRLLYESNHYAVFDVVESESPSSSEGNPSLHSLREQESIDAPQGFYYGTEKSSHTEQARTTHSGRTQEPGHQQMSISTGLQERRYTYSGSQRQTAPGTRDSTYTGHQESHHAQKSGASYTSNYTERAQKLSEGSDKMSRTGNVGMQQQSGASIELTKRGSGLYTAAPSDWERRQHDSQRSEQYYSRVDRKAEGATTPADRYRPHGYTEGVNQRENRKGEYGQNEEEMYRKGFENLMTEAVSSTKEINQFLYELWRTQRMCDIVIKVGEKEFHAHKLALAVHSEKFTNRYCEEAPSTTTTEVVLPDANAEATENLIHYIYTNELTLTADSIESVIISARQLGIKSALNFCQDYLNSFNEDSVLFLLPIAQRQGFPEVVDRMFAFINNSSIAMMQSQGFLQCEVHQVEWMISRDELVVSTELEVFFAVLRWINHDQKERIKYAPMLVGCVRLIYICPEDLVQHVEPEKHIFNIQKCFELLYFAFRYHAIKLSGSTFYTIMKVPPPRKYTIPVSEQSQIKDRRINERTELSTNKPYSKMDPAFQFSYGPNGSNYRQDGSNESSLYSKDSQPLPDIRHGAQTRRSFGDSSKTGFSEKTGILRSTGHASSRQSLQHRMSSGYCTADETPNRGTQTGSGLSQNSPQCHSNDTNRNFCPKKLNFDDSPTRISSKRADYRTQAKEDEHTPPQSSGREGVKGQVSRDIVPSRDTEQQQSESDSDATLAESGSSGSDKMPKPRQVVEKLHPQNGGKVKVKTRPDKYNMSRDRFLVIGGIDPFRVSEYNTSRMVEEFVPYKSEWNKKNTLPDSRHHACACLLDGFIYLVGGATYNEEKPHSLANPTSTCFRYDPDKDHWARISSLQTPRMYHGAGVLSGVVYAVGGHDYTGRALDSVEYYNADTDSWSYAANMTEPKLGVACIGYKGHLFVIGGSVDRGGKKVVLNTVECYDPKLNCWVRKRNLPKRICHACVLEVNNYLFLLGGASQETPGSIMESSDTVYRYSRLSEMWTEFTTMITPRHDAGAVAVGCNIYVVGGVCTQTGEGVDTIEVLDCDTATWEEENEEEFRSVIGVACVLMPRL